MPLWADGGGGVTAGSAHPMLHQHELEHFGFWHVSEHFVDVDFCLIFTLISA
jgi:hypothetical protein